MLFLLYYAWQILTWEPYQTLLPTAPRVLVQRETQNPGGGPIMLTIWGPMGPYSNGGPKILWHRVPGHGVVSLVPRPFINYVLRTAWVRGYSVVKSLASIQMKLWRRWVFVDLCH